MLASGIISHPMGLEGPMGNHQYIVLFLPNLQREALQGLSGLGRRDSGTTLGKKKSLKI